MKIVFLSPSGQLGGAEAVLLDLLRTLREIRPDWSMHVISGEAGPLLDRISSMDVTCEALLFPKAVSAFGENRQRKPEGTRTRIGAWSWGKTGRLAGWARAALGTLLYVGRLRRRLRKLHPDIVHSNGMKMHLVGALAKPGATALVWHLHDYLSSRAAMLPLLLRLAGRCNMVIANSESVAADLRQALPTGPPVHAVHNGIDSAIFTPDGPVMNLDQAAGLPPALHGIVRIGLVATFARWKGHEVFLRAVAALVEANLSTPTRFYVIGGPVYATAGSQRTLEELRGLAAGLGIKEVVGFTGFVTNVPAAMRALDIVVHASTEPEPFGLVIVQAMACARAVVSSAAGGARELVEPEVDALIHAPGNVGELAEAIARLVVDSGLRIRLGQAGHAKAQEDFGRVHMGKTMVPLYEQSAA